MRYKFVISVVLLILSVSIAAAQEEYDYSRFSYKGEVFGNLGSGSWEYDNSGLVYGGGIVFRPYPKAGFEIQFRHLQADDEYSIPGVFQQIDESGLIFSGAVHYYFSEMRFQPYVLLGGGYASRHANIFYRDPDFEHRSEFDEASVVIEAGTGVNIFLTNKISVRPDVRLMIGGIASVQGSANLCYHW
jgi:hypothetical protein